MIHVRKLGNLNALILLKIVLALQTNGENVIRIMFCRQWNRYVTNADEMLLLDLIQSLVVGVCGEYARHVITELCSSDSELTIEYFLIFVDCINLDCPFHQLATVVQHLVI